MRDTDSIQWLTANDLNEPLGLLHGNEVASVDDWTCAPIADFGKRYASRGEWILGLADEFRLLLPSLEPTIPGAA